MSFTPCGVRMAISPSPRKKTLRVCSSSAGISLATKEFIFAEADDDRRSHSRGDNFLRIARGESDERVGAGHYLYGFENRLFEGASFENFSSEMGDDFGIRFGDELVAFFDELILQVEIVFDDSVVDDDDFARAIAVRVGIFLGGTAVRGPAGVADAVDAFERGDADGLFQVAQLSGGAANFELAVVADDGDARGVIAAIFEAAQAVENERYDALRPDIADNAAHDGSLLEAAEKPIVPAAMLRLRLAHSTVRPSGAEWMGSISKA